MSRSRLLFLFTGSIAAAKACEVVSRLVQDGHRVRTGLTPAAARFVGPALLEGLTGEAVLADLFAPGAALDHIRLTRWADAVVVCPATAHTLNRLAAGLADDLVGALFLAHDRAKPWLVAPAMNPAMWAHPATRAAVTRLREWGVRFIPVGTGPTACGESGAGRMAEPAAIVAAVEAALARPSHRRCVLVTAGGTSEPIDAVRVITNRSTGTTGAMIASQLRQRGHEVVLLRARGAAAPAVAGEEETFESGAELDAALGRRLGTGRFDAVVHAAAVGDFGVEPVAGKMDSRVGAVLRLCPRPKLLDGLRGRSPRPLRVVAFKLTVGASEAEARAEVAELAGRATPDYIVHNDLTANGSASGGDFPATIRRPDGTVAVHCPSRAALSNELVALLEEAVEGPPPEASPADVGANPPDRESPSESSQS